LLEEVGVDVLFAPIEAEMYPLGRDAEPLLELPGLGRLAGDLEGAHRPGHFAGVVTVLKKLFDIVRPHVAVFGEKDFQQLRIVQHMVAEVAMPIEIVACETVREADGLAMSSRNRFLSDAEREIAPVLYRVLIGLRDTIRAKPGQLAGARKRALDQLQEAGFKTDYLEVRNAGNLQPNSGNSGEKRVLAAVWLGNTRLIDNIKV
jgi:pantoate--beta-alanine ligase